jgi:hypothetical protein
MNPAWYLRRLSRMEPSELSGRLSDQALRLLWRVRAPDAQQLSRSRRLAAPLQASVKAMPALSGAPAQASARLIACAEEILEGRWQVFAKAHPNLGEDPDWFVDARSGLRAPNDVYSFDVPYRSETRVGNIKYIWEPSRHHHLTVLAAAYHLTADERYAKRIARHLQSWWRENPFLRGPHWISGIELGLRLIAWSWTRQLLASWPGVRGLFEDNEEFLAQLYAHQFWLSRFPSRGSSANNHIIAEAAGQFVAACVFPFFKDSTRWRGRAAASLKREAVAQTFPCGSNRELATDYHGFVLELLLAAVVQGEAAGHPLSDVVWDTICKMTDVVAMMLDDRAQAPRQGDADDGIGLLLDDPARNRWLGLLATGKELFSASPWWPPVLESDLRTFLLTADLRPRAATARPERRPHLLPEAGQIYLRGPEGLWCRCDHGPHGFGRIAAHAHADALSIEYRIDGVEVFADPGTFCYHGDPKWRAYFRSTFAHNTLRLFGRDQSSSGGPFLWTRQAQSRLISADGLDEACDEGSWTAEHFGYSNADGLVHRRSVRLLRSRQELIVTDLVLPGAGDPVPGSLCWHLGPEISCQLHDRGARLSWAGGQALLSLPGELEWKLYRGDDALPAGWYSPSFDRKVPSVTLVGSGLIARDRALVTRLSSLAAPSPKNLAP